MAAPSRKIDSLQEIFHINQNSSKCKALGFAIAIILAIGGLIVLGVSIASLGASQHWWEFNALSKLGTLGSIVMMAIGASLSLGMLTASGAILCCKKNPKINNPENKDWTGLIINEVYDYPGNLTEEEKSKLIYNAVNEETIEIQFDEYEEFEVRIQQQDLLVSGDKVIVQEAIAHLKDGGGIEGVIHKNAGDAYKKELAQLQAKFASSNSEGHAAMIESGNLQKKGIEKVIVVSGPQRSKTKPTPEMENALYSCYYNSLLLTHQQDYKSIAFSTFQFPIDEGASIALKAIYDFIRDYSDTSIQCISIHCEKNLETHFTAYAKAIQNES